MRTRPPQPRSSNASRAPARPPASARPDRRDWRTILVGVVLIVAAAFLVGWPAIHGDWLWDDDTSITANATTRGPYSFRDIWVAPNGPDYFPLTATAFWAEWHLFGDDVTGYHVVNVALHAAGGLLLWLLLSEMRVPGAWLAGLLFVVHPLCVESVAWISELKNTLSQPPFLLAALFAVRADRRDAPRVTREDALALFWFLVSMFAKTSVVMFPVVMLLHAWWRRGTVRVRDVLRAAPFFLVSLVLGVVTILFQHGKAIGEETIPVGGAASRLALSGMEVAFYLGKILVPTGLLPIYPRWEVEPPRAWQFLPWVAVAAVAAVAWRYRSGWGRHLLFAGGFFLVMVFPVLGFVTIAYMRITWAADHFVYLPMVSILALVAAAATVLSRRLPADRRWTAAAAGAVVVALLAAGSWRYSAAWASERALWTHTLVGNPDAWQAHNRLGAVLIKEGDVKGAYEHFVASSRLRPDLGETNNNRGQALAMMGRIDEAIGAFEIAAAASPQIHVIALNLANAYSAANRHDDAERVLSELLVRVPDMLAARARRADVLAVQGHWEQAAAQYRMVLDKAPRTPVLWNNRGVCLLKLGRTADAADCFRRALALDPNLADAKKNLAAAEQSLRAATPAPK